MTEQEGVKKKLCAYCGEVYYYHCECMQPEYEEDEYLCNYGEDEGFCAISTSDYEIKEMNKGLLNKIRNKFSKKRKEELEYHYGRSALSATEWCSFSCPLRPRNYEKEDS